MFGSACILDPALLLAEIYIKYKETCFVGLNFSLIKILKFLANENIENFGVITFFKLLTDPGTKKLENPSMTILKIIRLQRHFIAESYQRNILRSTDCKLI